MVDSECLAELRQAGATTGAAPGKFATEIVSYMIIEAPFVSTVSTAVSLLQYSMSMLVRSNFAYQPRVLDLFARSAMFQPGRDQTKNKV